jgi:hypothetical protein
MPCLDGPARDLGLDAHLIARTRHTRTQAGMTHDQRRRNAAGAYAGTGGAAHGHPLARRAAGSRGIAAVLPILLQESITDRQRNG